MIKITGVAIKYGNIGDFCSLPSPHRHHHIIKQMTDQKISTAPVKGEQGFYY